jgi:type I restriction enzyme S subunit
LLTRFAAYQLSATAPAVAGMLATGATRARVNLGAAASRKLALPPLPEQRAIAAYLDRTTARIDALIEKKRRFIELLEEKRAAMITQAVARGLDASAQMKETGIVWFSSIPQHWNVERLKFSTTHIRSGKTPKGGAEVYVPSGVMLLRSQNVHNDGLRLQDVVFIDEDVDREMASTRIRPHDVLLNITGASIGRSSVVAANLGPANVNQHVCAIRTVQARLKPALLHLCLISRVIQAQISAGEVGTSREGLTFEDIGNLTMAVPPRGEQDLICDRISVVSESLNQLSSKAAEAIARLLEYRSTLIIAAVTGKIDVREASAMG